MRSKLFWAWLGIEVAAAMWFGWQVAKAQAKPWARRKPKRKPNPLTAKRSVGAVF